MSAACPGTSGRRCPWRADVRLLQRFWRSRSPHPRHRHNGSLEEAQRSEITLYQVQARPKGQLDSIIPCFLMCLLGPSLLLHLLRQQNCQGAPKPVSGVHNRMLSGSSSQPAHVALLGWGRLGDFPSLLGLPPTNL